MKSMFIFLILVFSATSYADTGLYIFDKQVRLIGNCTFHVRDVFEQGFSCYASQGSYSVNIKRPDKVSAHFDDVLNDLQTGENLAENDKSSVKIEHIEGMDHYYLYLNGGGISGHSYSICSNEACIGMTSTTLDPIKKVFSQLGITLIFDRL
ncbi:hypothetical protein [Agaribacterium sp. ZY112]|uniref:hypothetical protein n=1 Tax=Agaribacterium sp. ZY112 TaxID=3233574 RepID=UPI0035241B21